MAHVHHNHCCSPFGIEPAQLRAVLDTVTDYAAITDVWLFGARVAGAERPDSPIEIALAGRLPHTLLQAINTELQGLNPGYEIKITPLDTLSDTTMLENVRNGVLLYSRRAAEMQA